MELTQEDEFSAMLTQEAFMKNLNPITASPKFWASRERPPFAGKRELRQSKLGGHCISTGYSREIGAHRTAN